MVTVFNAYDSDGIVFREMNTGETTEELRFCLIDFRDDAYVLSQ